MTFLSDITGTGAEKKFTAASIPENSLKGHVWIVTGGHGGIGLETTKALALSGAKIYIASRTESKVRKAISTLESAHPQLKGRLEFLSLDLKSLKGVAKAAEEFRRREERLDGIVANAGIMATSYELTEDGIESQFQVNHLSHWLLMVKLAPLLEKTGQLTGHPSRIVNLSSFAHNFVSLSPPSESLLISSFPVSPIKIFPPSVKFLYYPLASPSFDSLKSINRYYDPMGYIRYSQAKLANILCVRELNKRYTSGNVKGIAVHPGFVASSLYDHQLMMKPMISSFIKTEEGAISSLYAATSPEVETLNLWGEYLVPFAKVKETTAYAKDPKLASDLWNLSQALCSKYL